MGKDKQRETLTRLWVTVLIITFSLVFVVAFLFPAGLQVFWGGIKLFLGVFWWIILPFPFWYAYHFLWLKYSEDFQSSLESHVLLELIPSKDIEKSPKLMEHVFIGLHDFSTLNALEFLAGWKIAQNRLVFEIEGREGEVHFYVRCPKKLKDNVEAQIYAHYPDLQIREAEDYTSRVPLNLPNEKWSVWGTTYSFLDNDFLPMRTYKHFQEDVTGKMIDPLANIVEVMAALPKKHHIWFQILIEAEKASDWRPAVKAYIKRLIDEALGVVSTNGDSISSVFGKFFGIFRSAFGKILGGSESGGSSETVIDEGFNVNKLPPGTQEKVKAIEEGNSKEAYRAVVRFVYIAPRDTYNKPLGAGGIRGAMRQFSDVNLNSLVPSSETKTFANYYFDEERELYRQRKIVQSFRWRCGCEMWIHINTEELATLYHFPDTEVVRNSAITRVESKREHPPANLPTGDCKLSFQSVGDNDFAN